MLKQQIEQDLKSALLAGDNSTATTLRGLKSAILYVEVAQNKREEGLDDTAIIDVLSKEAKKRQESADLYQQGGNAERADQELAEKKIIEKYLPAQLSDDELKTLIDKAVTELSASGPQDMGKVIAQVKQETAGAADGAVIARITKERLG